MSEKMGELIQFPGSKRPAEAVPATPEMSVAKLHELNTFLKDNSGLVHPAEVERLRQLFEPSSATYLITTLNDSTAEDWRENPELYFLLHQAIVNRAPHNPED